MKRFYLLLSPALKPLRFIFIPVFLLGMLFTVIQYLPILEEESPSHGLELAKKHKEDCDTDGDDDPEGQNDDPDPDGISDIDYFPISHFVYVLNRERFFRRQDTGWQHYHGNVSTPPPQS